jgi:hypothetical protein
MQNNYKHLQNMKIIGHIGDWMIVEVGSTYLTIKWIKLHFKAIYLLHPMK